jgi:hypothetical protein
LPRKPNADGSETAKAVAKYAKPVWVNIHFDNSFVTFKSLEPSPEIAGSRTFVGRFPAARAILDGKSSSPLPAGYLGGY